MSGAVLVSVKYGNQQQELQARVAKGSVPGQVRSNSDRLEQNLSTKQNIPGHICLRFGHEDSCVKATIYVDQDIETK